MKIRIAGNTEGPCYYTIKAKGFDLEKICYEESERPDYIARKDNLEISATSIEELLGLIAMYEYRKENWSMTEEEYKLYMDMKYGDKIFK